MSKAFLRNILPNILVTQKLYFPHPRGSYTNTCLSVLDSFYFSCETEDEPVALSVPANPISLYRSVVCG